MTIFPKTTEEKGFLAMDAFLQKPASSVLEMIGCTPMLHASRLSTGCCELYLKLENQNPGGSVKDRIALSMIEAAERDGAIQPGGTLIEATSGNTGLGLALVGAQKGYRCLFVIPDKMSEEKILHLKALGAQCLITRSDVKKGHPAYYIDMAERLARETPNSFLVSQFTNPANPFAHETTTAPEIWEQMNGQVDAIVAGVGSGGTLTGLARFFKKVSPQTEIVLADPMGSVLAEAVNTGTPAQEVGTWVVEGIGEDFVPQNFDYKLCDRAYSITDAEAIQTIHELLRQEGIIAGTSSGTLISAALRYCREQNKKKRVVTFVCETGNKYLSRAYNHLWLLDQGFRSRKYEGNLLDMISRRHSEHDAIVVRENDTLEMALKRMKLSKVHQLPVLSDDSKLTGLLEEDHILQAVTKNAHSLNNRVSEHMEESPPTLPKTASAQKVIELLKSAAAVLVADQEGFHGLVTRIDLINFLTRQKSSLGES